MTDKQMIPIEVIEKRIYLIRGEKVMLSTNLAELYGVEPKVLVQAIKRNRERFPSDFMFQLSRQEYTILKSQFVTSSWGGIRRATPYAFTEQGVAMLSSVLKSRRAVQVNIQIMRAFVRLGKFLLAHKELAAKLRELETRYEEHDEQIKAIFEAIRRLLEPPAKPRRQIGFRVEEPRVSYRVKRRKKQ
jgi:hypothetical protein